MMGLLGGDKKKVAQAIVSSGGSKDDGQYSESYEERKPENNMEDEMFGELMEAFKSGDVQRLKKSFSQAHEYSYMKMKK